MENNEDKRQYTPITAEIIRLQNQIDSNPYAPTSLIEMIEFKIGCLIGLLPAEKEALIEAYATRMYSGLEPETWFSETYTQDYKTK